MKEFGKSIFAKILWYIMTIASFVAFSVSFVTAIILIELGFYELSAATISDYLLNNFYFPTESDQSMLVNTVNTAYGLKNWVIIFAILSLLGFLVFLILLVSAAGKRRGEAEIHLTIFDKIPTDIYTVLVISIYAICFCVMFEVFDFGIWMSRHYNFAYLLSATLFNIFFALAGIAAIVLTPAFIMGYAVRIKAGTIFKNTIIFFCLKYCWLALKWCLERIKRFWGFVKDVIKNISVLWRTVLAVLIISFFEFMVIFANYQDTDAILTLWFIEKLILAPAVIFVALTLRKLQKAGEVLAEGNLSYRTDTKGMFWDFKKHGENLNSISVGMANAVEKEIKSERLKTELITNVSHDIKTPLTSIINYASLINEEPCDNDNIKEYSEVLVRQSTKLKRLMEDLVEASKAATGNVEVDLIPCDPAIFIGQAAGEYEEKLAASDLTLVTKLSETECKIMADGRRMWRVFDNLMNNICKYALPGTRVYISLDIKDDEAVFVFKNTSRDQLDLSEEELMERFVRGDKSRNTEGNGLGLSIAKSMAEVQGGKLKITIDGDLFKAAVSFPTINE